MYIYIRFKMFIFNEADQNFTENGVIDLDTVEEFQNQDYKEMDITIFQSIKFQRGGKGKAETHNAHGIGEILLDNEDIVEKLKPYIKIAYRYSDIDWNYDPPNGRFDEFEFPAKACTVEDFGKHKQSKETFDAWAGYSMICPDFDAITTRPEKTFIMTGSMSSFVINRGMFVIERCRDHDYCESDENIDLFI